MKVLLQVTIAAIIVLSGVVFWEEYQENRALDATHPALAAADLPELITAREFYLESGIERGHEISADGSLVARWGVEGGASVINVSRVSTMGQKLTITGASSFVWDPVETIPYVVMGRRFWRLDPENPEIENWIDVTPRGFNQFYIKNLSDPSSAVWIVSSKDRDPRAHDLYTVQKDGSQKSLLIRNSGKTLDWYVDKHANVLMRFDRLDDHGVRVWVRDRDAWRMLFDHGADDVFHLLEVDMGKMQAIALSSRNRDKIAYVRVDLRNGREAVLFRDSRGDISTSALNAVKTDGTVDLLYSYSDRVKYFAQSGSGWILKRIVEEFGQGTDIQ